MKIDFKGDPERTIRFSDGRSAGVNNIPFTDIQTDVCPYRLHAALKFQINELHGIK